MNVFSQQSRLARLTTDLGQDILVLNRFDGEDFMNGLFEYRVQAFAKTSDIDFDALIGTHATVEVETGQGAVPFDGIITEARWRGQGRRCPTTRSGKAIRQTNSTSGCGSRSAGSPPVPYGRWITTSKRRQP